MTNQHPITPPPELVQQWHVEAMKGFRTNGVYEQDIATQAARWGADQELEACCEWIYQHFQCGLEWSNDLRAARRPKPPSLKEQALDALHGIHDQGPTGEQVLIIRRALEALPND